MSILVNPAVVFSLSWFSVLLGMQVKWSDLIVETPFILTVTIYSTIVSSLMAFIVVRYLLPRKKRLNFVAPISNDLSFSGVGVLSTILVTGHLFELLLEGNLPLFSLFFGKYVLYADFGIRSKATLELLNDWNHIGNRFRSTAFKSGPATDPDGNVGISMHLSMHSNSDIENLKFLTALFLVEVELFYEQIK